MSENNNYKYRMKSSSDYNNKKSFCIFIILLIILCIIFLFVFYYLRNQKLNYNLIQKFLVRREVEETNKKTISPKITNNMKEITEVENKKNKIESKKDKNARQKEKHGKKKLTKIITIAKETEERNEIVFKENKKQQVEFKKHKGEKKKKKIKMEFMDLYPKINISDDKNISDINELFLSRRLYINDKNITKEYIRYIRPIDEKEEQKYKKILHPNLTFDYYPNETRKNQINVEEFYNICSQEKLIDSKIYKASNNPLISIVLPVYNKKDEIIKSLRSIQNQSFKNFELIIIDDGSTDGVDELLENLLKTEPRLRFFKHLKNMGVWRTRMDGFLYSKGKYILHFDPGDYYPDNYVLEDSYNLVEKYTLDTVKFSFVKDRTDVFVSNITNSLAKMKKYKQEHTKINYGRPNYDVHELGYGTIWNRLVRANLFVKGLELLDEYILNAYKNLWEDMWWCDLLDRVSFSNLIVNRLGYIYLCTYHGAGEPKIFNRIERDKTIREFIYFWYFDYHLLPKNDTKASIVKTLREYNNNDHLFCRIPMRLSFLSSNFPIFERLLQLLINDTFVIPEDKRFVKELYYNTTGKNISSFI